MQLRANEVFSAETINQFVDAAGRAYDAEITANNMAVPLAILAVLLLLSNA